MSIVLQSTSGGSVTINEPTTASNFTQTLPASTGTVMVSGNMPAFSAYLSASQTVSAATYTKVNLDTELFDTNSNFASSRFTPTVAGYYQINGMLFFDSTVTVNSPFAINIYKNGGGYATNNTYVSSGGSGMTLPISTIVYLNGSTDYVELYGYIGGGSGTLKFAAGATTTYMNGSLIRAA